MVPGVQTSGVGMWWLWTAALGAETDPERSGLIEAGTPDPQAPPAFDLPQGPDTDAIINGEPATIDEWPMTGGLIMNASATVEGFGTVNGRALMCSSTLIAPDVVLLAAHCVDIEGLVEIATQSGYSIENFSDLQFGWSRQTELYQWDLMDSAINGPKDWPEDNVFAKTTVHHPDFDIATLQVGLAKNNDIALMFLEEPVFDVPFAVLPTEEEADQIVLGSPVTIVGWGQQQQDAIPGTVGYKFKADSTVDEIARFEIQIGKDFEAGRKCHGDSGGPTFQAMETTSALKERVIGVTSHAYDATTDCRVTGGVDTRVDFFLDWIDAEMTKACEDGTRVWCDEPGIIPPPDESGVFAFELLAEGEGEEEKAKGCGCDSTPSRGIAALLPALSLLSLRRRR